jgi:hypothetical protein
MLLFRKQYKNIDRNMWLLPLDCPYAGLGQIAVVLRTDPGGWWAGTDVVWADEYSAGPASGRHRLSRQEHDVLFSAGDFDFVERGAFGGAVSYRAIAIAE